MNIAAPSRGAIATELFAAALEQAAAPAVDAARPRGVYQYDGVLGRGAEEPLEVALGRPGAGPGVRALDEMPPGARGAHPRGLDEDVEEHVVHAARGVIKAAGNAV